MRRDSILDPEGTIALQNDEPGITTGESFAAECERCRPMLLRIAMKRTGSRSSAEDMVQQAFLKAWNGRTSFRGVCRLSTWLTRILINQIHQVFRCAEHRLLEYCDDPAVLETQQARCGFFSWVGNAETELLKNEQTYLARKAVHTLPAAHRSVLILACYEEKTTEEISIELGFSVAAVKSRKLRARLELQRRLKALCASSTTTHERTSVGSP